MVKKRKSPKPAYGQLWGIQTQKEVKSNQKQLSCKKRCGPKKAMMKKDVKWWRPRNGCDGRLMVKILITTIQVNFVPRPSGTKFTRIVVIKSFTINLPSQPFLGHHLGFRIFFHHGLFGAAPCSRA